MWVAILLILVGFLLLIQLCRVPFDLRRYDVAAMPRFSGKDLQAGDLVFLRWGNWYYTKMISYFTHVQIIISIKGKLYAAEIRTDAQLDALDGTLRQMCIRDPATAITTYGGEYCVRRRAVPLTETQSQALTDAVMSYRNDTYTTEFLATYIGSFTPFNWRYRNKGRAWCSQAIADWLHKAKIANFWHPVWVWPSDLASKFTPFGMNQMSQAQWLKEQVPVF